MRTRRFEVIRYSCRINPPDESSGVASDDLSAFDQSPEFTFDPDEPLALPEPVPLRESPMFSRRLLKKLKP